MKKILILTDLDVYKILPFKDAAKKLGIKVVLGTLADLKYDIGTKSKMDIKTGNESLKKFDVIYLRLVGKKFEEASIVTEFANKNRIKIVDGIYQKSRITHIPFTKGLETVLLEERGLPVPRTVFTSIEKIREEAPKKFGFPLIIKSTTGIKSREVWSPKNKKELGQLCDQLAFKEKAGERFLVQEFINAKIRIRVLVIGGRSVAGIIRPTKWRTGFDKDEPQRGPLLNIPKDIAKLAQKAAAATFVDIAGIDILKDVNGKYWILETNLEPSWKSVKSDANFDVETEILKYLMK